MSFHVTFRVGMADYAIPASDVLHLESYEIATPIPGTQSYVAGLVQVRGRLVPVVDLRKRFGLPAVEHSLDHRVIVVQAGVRAVGLAVDLAREVIKIDDASFSKPPELVEQQSSGFVKGIATVSSRMFLLVDVPKILGEELVNE